MPSATNIKDLYMARNFEELRKKAELPGQVDNKLSRIIPLCGKFQVEAKDSIRIGDEERAYIFYFRFMTLFQMVSRADQPEFMSKINHASIETCLTHLEKLQSKLQQRYTDKLKSHEDRKAVLFPVPGNSVKVDTSETNGFNSDIDHDKDDNDSYSTITPAELVTSIQQKSQLNKVLLIDIRSVDEFSETCIAANKMQPTGEVNVINIPGDLISPGLTFALLSRKVNFGLTKDALDRRRSMDNIVILDKITHHFEKDSKCVLLAMALSKWDHSPERVKRKPVLLKGGILNFAITYPMYVTRADIILQSTSQPSPKPKTTPALAKGLYDFDEEEKNAEEEKRRLLAAEEEKIRNSGNSPTPSTMNGFISSSSESMNRLSLNRPGSGYPSLGGRTSTGGSPFGGLSTKVPGIAKPIIPDRSSKPVFGDNSLLHNDGSNDVPMKSTDDSSDQEMTSIRLPAVGSSTVGISQKSVSNDFNQLRSTLPPKPDHLLSSLSSSSTTTTNGVSGLLNGMSRLEKPTTENGANKQMDIDDDDDDFVAGKFDDLNSKPPPNVPQTPVHRRSEAKSSLYEESLSEEDNDEEMESDGGERHSTLASRSKPISVGRPSNGTSSGFGGSGSLSRSLSSPNIAQFDESQHFSFNTGSGTPKSTIHPIVDRSVKPPAYAALMRKHRDFSPQFSSSQRIPGLRNLGNTCYFNSIIQCLNNTSELTNYLVSGHVHINSYSKFGSNGELTIELMELLKQMTSLSTAKYISPKDLKCAVIRHIPDFVEYKQQDAHEFLVRFLDRIHADLNKRSEAKVADPSVKDPNYYDKLSINAAVKSFWGLHMSRNQSIITDLFEGLLVSTITCLDCKTASKALEAFTCLSLPIQEGGRTSIDVSLKMFLRKEQISDEAAWQCPTCKEKRNAEKCTYIFKLPKILVIHLKRFSYDGMWRQKISSFVDFPIDNLTVDSHEAGEMTRSYSLYGVVNHTGSLDGGHYIAYSRNIDQNIGWQKYDDQDVNAVSASEVITQNAYVLFYQQKNS